MPDIGEEMILWIFRIIMILMILFGVSLMINNYYSKVDVRATEALALSDRIMGCISANGIADMAKIYNDNIMGCTKLDENEMYLNLTLVSMVSEKRQGITIGNQDLQVYCKYLESKGEMKKNIECLNQTFYVLLGNEQAKIDMLLAIRKIEKNI